MRGWRSSLVGKSFAVTDDGFLTRIRAAQFSGDVTRVVLDVHQVAEYSAFLLPNPYRLIIDIHGKQNETLQDAGRSIRRTGVRGSDACRRELDRAKLLTLRAEATEVSSLPPMPVTDGSAGFGLPARGATSEVEAGGGAAAGDHSVEADDVEAGAELGGEQDVGQRCGDCGGQRSAGED